MGKGGAGIPCQDLARLAASGTAVHFRQASLDCFSPHAAPDAFPSDGFNTACWIFALNIKLASYGTLSACGIEYYFTMELWQPTSADLSMYLPTYDRSMKQVRKNSYFSKISSCCVIAHVPSVVVFNIVTAAIVISFSSGVNGDHAI